MANRVLDRPAVPLLCLGATVLLWGTSFAATKAVLPFFGPMGVIWLRMVIGSVVILLVWHKIPRPQYRAGDWKWLALMSLMQPVLYYPLESYALGLTSSSQAGVVSALVPLLVAVGARLFLAEELSLLTLAGLALSIGGVTLLSLGGKVAQTAPQPVLGNMLELAAMTCAAGYMLVVKHLCGRYDPWLLTGVMTLVGAVAFMPGALAAHPVAWVAAPASAWAALAYLGIAVTLGGGGLYNMAVTRMPASRAARAVNLMPVVAVLAGWLALGDALSAVQMGGIAIVATGVVLGELRGKPQDAEDHAAKAA